MNKTRQEIAIWLSDATNNPSQLNKRLFLQAMSI